MTEAPIDERTAGGLQAEATHTSVHLVGEQSFTAA